MNNVVSQRVLMTFMTGSQILEKDSIKRDIQVGLDALDAVPEYLFANNKLSW